MQSRTAPPTIQAPYPVVQRTSKMCARFSFSGIKEGIFSPGTSASNPSSMKGVMLALSKALSHLTTWNVPCRGGMMTFH